MKRTITALLSAVILLLGLYASSLFFAPECDENCQGEVLAAEASQELALELPPPTAMTNPTPTTTTQPTPTVPTVTETTQPSIPDEPTPDEEEAVATTMPPPETTEPATTIPPPTTIPSPGMPDRNIIAVNHGFAWLTAPALGWGEPWTVLRADDADDGYKALLGNPAWFPSTGRSSITGQGLNDLSLPGEGGVVAIGAHRTSKYKPFANLHLLVAGDRVEVKTGYGIYTYEVTKPCPEGDQRACTLSGEELLRGLLARPRDGEVLYLFSCDDDKRMFVEFKLVDARGHVA